MHEVKKIMETKRDIHRSKELDRYIGKQVTVTFYDGQTRTGELIYIDRFCEEYGFKRPWFYHIGNTCFRKSSVTKITEKAGA